MLSWDFQIYKRQLQTFVFPHFYFFLRPPLPLLPPFLSLASTKENTEFPSFLPPSPAPAYAKNNTEFRRRVLYIQHRDTGWTTMFFYNTLSLVLTSPSHVPNNRINTKVYTHMIIEYLSYVLNIGQCSRQYNST